MDNPCKNCENARIEYLDDFEYGCDKPCEKAKEFYKILGNKLDELIGKIEKIINNNN